MRVDKLELSGFKSFGDRTVFNLHPGITCIVGPNGCGKSNVVDAFKWVLGEQSAKSLRGGKMEEVIFAGSQNKKPKGMGEVTLTVSGLGPSDNGKDSTMSVTRRLYRSGESDYMLNRTSCRLRDIRDVFLDTGLEVKSYSILEQDRISAILAAKPDERRFIIEEVAGVVKYKVRRNEAQNKLEHSRHNLQRINDVIGEVKRQINSLDRQVKKAERYKRLMQELKDIDIRIAAGEQAGLKSALEEVLRHLGSLREEDSMVRAEMSRLETDMETRRIELVEKEKALGELQAEMQKLERRMADEQREAAVLKAEKEHLEENADKLRHRLEENSLKRQQAAGSKEQVSQAREQLSNEISTLSEELDGKSSALGESERAVSEKEQLLEIKRRDLFRLSDELGAIRNERHRHQATLDSMAGREEGLKKESEDLMAQLQASENARRETEAAMLKLNGELQAMLRDRQELEGDIRTHRERLEALRGEIARVREELASAASRADSLREMVFAESTGEELRGEVDLVSTVADIIDVPRQYELAVESALGEAVSGFVLKDGEGLRKAVSAVRSRDMGRTALVSLGDTAADGQGAVGGERPLPEGATARASDVVKAEERFKSLVRALLGEVVLVGDLDAALAAVTSGSGFTLVTPDGEIVRPSGVVVAGKGTGILTLKRKLRELNSEIEGRKARLQRAEEESDGLTAGLAQKETSLESLAERTHDLDRDLSVLRHKAERIAEEVERTNRKLSMLRIERDELQKERESLQQVIAHKDGEISAQEQKKSAAEGLMSGLQEEISSMRSELEERRSQVVELRLSLNSSRERLSALGSEEAAAERLMSELAETEGQLRQEIASTGNRISEIGNEMHERAESLRALAGSAQGVSERIAAQREVMAAETDEAMRKEKELKSLRQKTDEASQRLSELDVKRAEHKLRLENLRTNIRNTYDVELDNVEPGQITDEDRERHSEVKEKIEKLGPVSLGSIEEYDELKGRYDFLTGQQEDLVKSIAELEEAITRINTTTRKKLREAYDALKLKFDEVFKLLFGGGRSELILTDEHNILDSGIEIVAQPPGKKLRNISLLSGGEKTLTALALLFASFLIKPAPLCILDEADAALDESNTHKFARMIKDLSSDIQFIVVTHNRVTMETADYIYGVTMEEPGNSKVISMELSKA